MNWKDFIGAHRGEKIVVVGLSPESRNNFVNIGCPSIGVNDIARYHYTNYTVVIDPQACFTEERWSHVLNSKSEALFSPYDIPHPGLCKIRLTQGRGSKLLSSDTLDISMSSTFVAINIAFWMGANKIGITGQDHTDPKHSLTNKVRQILEHYDGLRKNLAQWNVQLVCLSPGSRLNEVLTFEPAVSF